MPNFHNKISGEKESSNGVRASASYGDFKWKANIGLTNSAVNTAGDQLNNNTYFNLGLRYAQKTLRYGFDVTVFEKNSQLGGRAMVIREKMLQMGFIIPCSRKTPTYNALDCFDVAQLMCVMLWDGNISIVYMYSGCLKSEHPKSSKYQYPDGPKFGFQHKAGSFPEKNTKQSSLVGISENGTGTRCQKSKTSLDFRHSVYISSWVHCTELLLGVQ